MIELTTPIKNCQSKCAQQPQKHIQDRIFKAAHHMSAKEKVEQVLVEFPEDDRCACGSESKKDLNRGRYHSND